jgi:outer membrane immunogenic protein
MFGPKVSAPIGRIRPFAQALFGGAHISVSDSESGGSANAFAWAIGGGLDANVLPHVGIRLIQAEYFMTKFDDGLNNRQNNARISAGVTFRF